MANSTERVGVSHCGEIVARIGWFYREQPTDDVGIDAYIEIYDSQTGTQLQLLAAQIKTGESWFREEKNGCVIFRFDEKHYNYWLSSSVPCIIVLYDQNTDACIWQKLTKDTMVKSRKKGYKTEVPLSQVFIDNQSKEMLLEFTKLPESVTNYNFLLSQKMFMQIIKDGGLVKLHSTEWINKSSGRGETELIVDDGNEKKIYSYPYWFPFTPYTKVFPRLFPWAKFIADEEFFEEFDEANWREYHCYYDKEDSNWLIVGDTFEEYRKKLNPMRSIIHAGGVAEYMMILKLNELGEAFLSVDEFVSNKQPYSDTRPLD